MRNRLLPPSGTRSLNSKQRRFQVERLRIRDGDNCGICGQKMFFPSVRDNQPSMATLDHIISVYNGGSNHLQNMRLAHRSCNIQRSHGSESMAMPDPHGNPPHRFTVKGRRYHPTRYWDMFKTEYREDQ